MAGKGRGKGDTDSALDLGGGQAASTADRLNGELRSLPSGVEKTAYHEAKGIVPLPGATVRNGDVLVPGYDVEGKLWTIQYIKETGQNDL
jgi:phage/plasmid primase-like uncharacterized protein